MVFRPGLLRCNRKDRQYIEMSAIVLSNWWDLYQWWSVNTGDMAIVIVQEGIMLKSEFIGVTPKTVYEHSDIVRCMKRKKHD